ncbi:MAG: Matrixin, partial [Thermoanaerobaculia bacterium]|nr:Matrixin [Thermoanaerobaculia bacterium]
MELPDHMNTKKLPILSSILCSMVLLSVSAYGATFVVRPDRSLVRVADAIVVGSALTSYAAETANGGIETVTSVSIEEVVKGRLTASAIDVVEPGGEVRGRLSIVAGAPQFAPGRRTLLFLMRTGPNRWSVLDLAVGKFTFADDRIGRKILVRDEDEVVGLDPDLQPHQEPRRKADDFLQFVREETRGVHSQIDYTVPVSELTEPTLAPAAGFRFVPTAESLHPRALVAPYSANSYTMTISGSQGSRWNVFPSAVTFFMGTTQEAGAPGGGATAIQTAFASWNGDTGSNVNYVYGGVDDGTHTQGLHAPDGRNTVLFERDLSAWGAPPFTCSGNSYSGTLGIGGITSASGSNTVGSETFVTTGEADVEMNRGIANCTVLFNNGEFNSGVTHEIGHTLGFRHADQTRNSGAACTTDASLECSSHAIMTAVVTPGINAALQTWDIHAVQAVYPGSTGGGCTIPT